MSSIKHKVFKDYLICNDPAVKFIPGEKIYVKGEILSRERTSLTFQYFQLKEFILFQIDKVHFTSSNGHYHVAKLMMIDPRFVESEDVLFDHEGNKFYRTCHLIFNYSFNDCKMKNPYIEVKSKI